MSWPQPSAATSPSAHLSLAALSFGRTEASSPVICPAFASPATAAPPDHRGMTSYNHTQLSCCYVGTEVACFPFLACACPLLVFALGSWPRGWYRDIIFDRYIINCVSCPAGACSQIRTLSPGSFSGLPAGCHYPSLPRGPCACEDSPWLRLFSFPPPSFAFLLLALLLALISDILLYPFILVLKLSLHLLAFFRS